jgi:hypothetical protein
MEDLSIFKKYKLFRYFKKLLKDNKEIISNKKNGLNLRIDKAQRIYTVINCSPDVAKYGKNLAEKEIKEYVTRAEKLFINIGILEYVGIRDIQQISELDFLVVFGYKGFNTSSFYNRLYILYVLLGISAILSIFFLI